MPDRNDFVIAREGDVVLSWATGTPGVPGSFSALGCPKGTWNFNEQVAEVDDNLDNWCSAVAAAIEGFSPGATTITISGTMELILDDAAYLSMKAAVRAKTYGFMKVLMQDNDDSNTEVEVFGGYLTQFNRQLQGSGPSDVSVSFRANEIFSSTSYT